jgi:hypothetical protein
MTNPSFSAGDELLLFEVAGLTIRLTDDAQHIEIVGPDVVLDAAKPVLVQHRDALLEELQRRAAADAERNS